MEKEIELEQEAVKIYTSGGAVDSVNGYTGTVVLKTSDLQNNSDYQNGSQVQTAIDTAIAGKQDILTAGDNISISSNNTISAVNTTYSAGTGLSLTGTTFSINTGTVATKQDITNEATARENADISLQGQIDALSAASDVTDIVGTYADLQAYDTSKLKDNDIIKVLQDETQDDETTYYRWSVTTQTFTLIGEEGPYYTKSETDTLLQAKENSITSDNKLSADLVDDTGTTNQFATSSQLTKLDNLVNIESIGSNLSLNSSTGELSATDTTYTAGTNVNISAQNVISATDTTYSDFTGTDGVSAGTSGLVPAPATTDAGKFLKSDGTWDTAGGGGGDTVYSTKTTSNSATGGAVYIGNLGTDQIEVEDPTTTDNHYKYFWALPGYYSGTQTPNDRTVNLMGIQQGSGGTGNITIGWNATTDNFCQNNIIIGDQAITASNNGNVVIGASARNQGASNVVLGSSASNTSYTGSTVTIGNLASTGANSSVAIGAQTNAYQVGSVALGRGAYPTRAGEVHIGADSGAYGFDNTIYRVIGGVHDGQELHDAATLAQGNTLSDSAPTTSTVGVLGQLYTDTTNMHTYQCTAVSGGTYTWTQRW